MVLKREKEMVLDHKILPKCKLNLTFSTPLDVANEVLTASFVVSFTANVHCTFNYIAVAETRSIDAEDIYVAGKVDEC